MRAEEKILCVFEGAGARGIAHVGALRAIETSGVPVAGYAGTSAGSLVAALASVGYRANDLYNIDDPLDDERKPRTILTRLRELRGDGEQNASPRDIFGSAAWSTLAVLQRLMGSAPIMELRVVLGLCAVILATVLFGSWALPIAVALGVAALTALFTLVLRGLVSLDPVRDALDKLLEGQSGQENLTFAQHRQAGYPPLKIVSADISARQLQLFSAEVTPDIAIADAVAASIAIPIVFQPRRIEGHAYVDGGIVSNLPVWAFDEERELDPDLLTAAIEIKAPLSNTRKPGLAAMLTTAVFGAAPLLNTRQIAGLSLQTLKVDLGLLDFGMTHAKARTIQTEALEATRKELIATAITLRNDLSGLCGTLAEQTRSALAAGNGDDDAPDHTVRVAVAMESGTVGDRYRTIATSGYDMMADERAVYAGSCPALAAALDGGASRFYLNLPDDADWPDRLGGVGARWIAKRTWRDAQWHLAVALPEAASGKRLKNRRICILLDGDLDLAPLSPVLDDLKIFLQQTIYEVFKDVQDKLMELPDGSENLLFAERAEGTRSRQA